VPGISQHHTVGKIKGKNQSDKDGNKQHQKNFNKRTHDYSTL